MDKSAAGTAKQDVKLRAGYTGDTMLLRSMGVGFMLVFRNTTIHKISALASQLSKKMGRRYKCAKMDDGSVRVWRLKDPAKKEDNGG